MKPTSEAEDFVAFTICPTQHNAYKAEALEMFGIHKDAYRNGNYTGNSREVNPWDIFHQVTFGLHELVRVIRVHVLGEEDLNSSEGRIYLLCSQSRECPSALLARNCSGRTLTRNGDEWKDHELFDLYTLKEHYYHRFGRCFEFQFGKNLVRRGIYTVAIKPIIGRSIYVYVNTPGQFLSLDEKSKVYTTLGMDHYVNMHYTVEIDSLGEQSHMPCSVDMDLGLDDCLYKNTAENMMRHFNCVVPFLPPNNSQPICNSGTKQPLKNYKHFLDHNQRNMCKIPCKKMTVYFGMMERNKKTGVANENKSYVRIYLKSNVQYTETVLDYPIVSMLAGL